MIRHDAFSVTFGVRVKLSFSSELRVSSMQFGVSNNIMQMLRLHQQGKEKSSQSSHSGQPCTDRRNGRFGVNGFNYSLTSPVVSSSSSVVFSLITACLFCRYPKITLPFIERNIIKSNSGFVTSSIRADRFRPHLHKSVFIFKHIHTASTLLWHSLDGQKLRLAMMQTPMFAF